MFATGTNGNKGGVLLKPLCEKDTAYRRSQSLFFLRFGRPTKLLLKSDIFLLSLSRALSLSLPITADRMVRGERVMHYFDNLLPDSDIIRECVRKRYKLKSLDPAQLPALFPEEVWSSIRNGIRRQCSIFLAGQSGVTG